MNLATGPCDMATGTTVNGYVRLASGGGGRRKFAHVIAWEAANGPKPLGMHIMHLCDENYPAGDTTYRRCRRLDHLRLGTPAENMRRMAETKRAATGARNRGGISRRHIPSGDEHWTRRSPERLVRTGGARGSKNIHSRLSAADVLAIRVMQGTLADIAARYGVGIYTIRDIRARKTWRHLV